MGGGGGAWGREQRRHAGSGLGEMREKEKTIREFRRQPTDVISVIWGDVRAYHGRAYYGRNCKLRNSKD